MASKACCRCGPEAIVADKKMARYALRRIDVIKFQKRSHLLDTIGFAIKTVRRVLPKHNAVTILYRIHFLETTLLATMAPTTPSAADRGHQEWIDGLHHFEIDLVSDARPNESSDVNELVVRMRDEGIVEHKED